MSNIYIQVSVCQAFCLAHPKHSYYNNPQKWALASLLIFLKRKLRLREVRWHAHTASEFSNWHLNSSLSDCIVKLSSGCRDLEWVHNYCPRESWIPSEKQTPLQLFGSQSWGACQHLQEEARPLRQLLWRLVSYNYRTWRWHGKAVQTITLLGPVFLWQFQELKYHNFF